MKISKSINMFLKYCKNINLSKHTLYSYEFELKRLVKFLDEYGIDENEDINMVTVKILKAHFIELQGRFAISSVRKAHAVLSTFYRYLTEDVECVEVNPIFSVRLKFKHESKKQPVVKRNEMTDIMNVLDAVPKRRRTFYYHRNKLMVQLLYGCGLRVSELINLKYSDFDEVELSFKIVAKGDKDHKIFVDNDEILATYYKVKELKKVATTDWLFSNKSGERITTETVRYAIKNILGDAGIERRITPHSFRRGCATALIEDGVDVAIVKDVLGHANINTTMRYVNLSDKAIKDTMTAHCPLNNIR